jgi:DNA end-binding protein Ku
MQQTGRAALGRYAARGKQYLVMLRPVGDALVMQQLHYADEIRPRTEVPIGEGQVKEAELKLAVQLVEQISTDEFRPESYQDDVRQRVRALIERKVAGEEISVSPAETRQGAQIIDLMEALKASLTSRGAPGRGESASPAVTAVAASEKRRPAKRAPSVGSARKSARDKTSKSSGA